MVALSGKEMMLHSLIKAFGIDPEAITKDIASVGQIMADIKATLVRVEAQNERALARLDALDATILARLDSGGHSQSEANGLANTRVLAPVLEPSEHAETADRD